MEKFPVKGRPDSRTGMERLTDTIAISIEKAHEKIRGFIDRLERRLNLLNAVSWQAEGFDIMETLQSRAGPLIEVGGPTTKGFDLVSSRDIEASAKEYFTSNINEGHYIHRGFADRRRMVRVAPVDFVADGRNLPLKDGSVGALFAAYLGQELRSEVMTEAKRVLEPGGLLVWQGTVGDDFDRARENGLRLVSYEWELPQEISSGIPEGLNFANPESLHPEIVRLAKEKMPEWLVVTDYDELESLSQKARKDKIIQFEYGMYPDACIFQK